MTKGNFKHELGKAFGAWVKHEAVSHFRHEDLSLFHAPDDMHSIIQKTIDTEAQSIENVYPFNKVMDEVEARTGKDARKLFERCVEKYYITHFPF